MRSVDSAGGPGRSDPAGTVVQPHGMVSLEKHSERSHERRGTLAFGQKTVRPSRLELIMSVLRPIGPALPLQGKLQGNVSDARVREIVIRFSSSG